MKHRTMLWTSCIMLCACDDHVGPTTEQAPAFDVQTITAEGAFQPPFTGDITVRVLVDASFADETQGAIDTWMDAWAPSDGEPAFSLSSGSDTLTITFTDSGNYFCGTGEYPSQSVEIRRQAGSTPNCAGRPATPLSQLEKLLLHEIGHAIGYRSLDAFGGTEGCVMNIPTEGPLAGYPCTSEQQLAFWDFGDRDSVHLNLPMISSVSLTGLSLNPGDTVWVHAEYDVEGVHPEHDPAWSIDDSTTIARIISRSGDSVRVAALATGNTTLRVQLQTDKHVVWPAPSPASAPIGVSGPPAPDPCFTVESSSTWQSTDQHLNASCSDQGQNIRYRWRFEAGGAWTDTLTTTQFDFDGHGATGSKAVTLQVIDTSTGRDSTTSTTINVSSGTMTVSGEIFITEKATYPYLSSAEAKWYERYPPDPDWDLQVDWYTDSIARTWPAGEYSVDLRAQDNRNGVLRRGRLAIAVCTQTQTCGQARAGAMPSEGGSVFGAGPLLMWTEGSAPRALQFYQLMGNHSVRSPFETVSWLEDEGGKVSNAPYLGTVSWQHELLTGGASYSFTVEPPTSGAYVFGFALDPDLGDDAADDSSGYDQDTGMLYAADGSRAIGFMLRSGKGNALATVVQYGTHRFAPLSPTRLADQVLRGGIDLLPGPSDVQFVMAAEAATGAQVFRVVVLEADGIPALLKLARAVK